MDDLGLAADYELRAEIKFFGDNYAGDFAGFDFSNNAELVVEFWHEDGSIYETNQSFKDYISGQMLIGAQGEDERA